MIVPRRTPLPPSFLRTVIALGYFFSNVFWIIGWFRFVLKNILGIFETNFGYERLEKNHWICEHDHTSPEKGERGKIYMVTYIEYSLKLELLN